MNQHRTLWRLVRAWTLWTGDPPGWVGWAQPGDVRFTRRLILGCAAIGICGGLLFPYTFVIIAAAWVGLLVGMLRYPTPRRLMIVMVLGCTALWPWLPLLISGSDGRPWLTSG